MIWLQRQLMNGDMTTIATWSEDGLRTKLADDLLKQDKVEHYKKEDVELRARRNKEVGVFRKQILAEAISSLRIAHLQEPKDIGGSSNPTPMLFERLDEIRDKQSANEEVDQVVDEILIANSRLVTEIVRREIDKMGLRIDSMTGLFNLLIDSRWKQGKSDYQQNTPDLKPEDLFLEPMPLDWRQS
jgi:hypothetical protein